MRFEDVLSTPDATIQQISVDAQIDRIGGSFTNVSSSTKQAGTTNSDYRDHYAAER